MSAVPHERPEFTNATEFTVKITYVVAGGQRQATASRRARKVASSLADAAARAARLVDVTAVAGPSHEGEILWASPVCFSRANRGTQGPDGRLDRYLDADHELAMRSLALARACESGRCDRHRHTRLVVLEGDPSTLERLAREDARGEGDRDDSFDRDVRPDVGPPEASPL